MAVDEDRELQAKGTVAGEGAEEVMGSIGDEGYAGRAGGHGRRKEVGDVASIVRRRHRVLSAHEVELCNVLDNIKIQVRLRH